MSHIDKLLSLKLEDVRNTETKTIEIKRLSQKLGEPYEVVVKPISHDEYRRIQQRATNIKKKGRVDMDVVQFNTGILLGGIAEPDLTNEDLLKHFECHKAQELADILFSVGEQDRLVEEILTLSGIRGEEREDEDISETLKKQ